MPSGFMESWASVNVPHQKRIVVGFAGSNLLSISIDTQLILILGGRDLRCIMKAGDLVKRSDTFKEWMKHNSWMSLDEEQEIGIVVEIESDPNGLRNDIVVHWPVTGISWEPEENVEKIK